MSTTVIIAQETLNIFKKKNFLVGKHQKNKSRKRIKGKHTPTYEHSPIGYCSAS